MATHDRDDGRDPARDPGHNMDEPMIRPDGHRYDRPESPEETRSKSWDYAALGLLVVVIMLLIATGTVPIFDL